MKIFQPPLNEPIVDSKGRATPSFSRWLSRITQQQQIHLGDDGYLVPHKTSVELSALPSTKTSNLV